MDFRYADDAELLELTGDDTAAFDYLKTVQDMGMDDSQISDEKLRMQAELDKAVDLQGKAAASVDSLTADSEKLGKSIVAADAEIAATESELAATKAQLAGANDDLEKTKIETNELDKARTCV